MLVGDAHDRPLKATGQELFGDRNCLGPGHTGRQDSHMSCGVLSFRVAEEGTVV